MKVCEANAFHRRIVTRAGERDHALFSSIGVDDQALEPRRNELYWVGRDSNRNQPRKPSGLLRLILQGQNRQLRILLVLKRRFNCMSSRH